MIGGVLDARLLKDQAMGKSIVSIVPLNSGNAPASALSDPSARSSEPTSQQLRQILAIRRARAEFFDPKLFSDPAWDMLLELYCAELAGTKISVTSLCIGANVPATTALRWMRRLKDRGLVRRVSDLHDARRMFVFLTEKGSGGMRAYFQSIERMGLHFCSTSGQE